MKFLFVDRILELDPGKKTIGVKHITPDDFYLCRGPEGIPCLLPSIIGETLGQLCAWNVINHYAYQLRPVAGVVKAVEVLGHAHIGQTLHLESTIESLDEDAVLYNSVASVEGKPVLRLHQALGPMLPMQQFSCAEDVKMQFSMIYRKGVWQAPAKSLQNLHLDMPSLPPQESFDHILEWEAGKKLLAQKNISVLGRHFVDHFPRKPVYPLSLLLHCKLALADRFLADYLSPEAYQSLRLVALRKIKMSQFLQPGDSITTELTLTSHAPDQIILQFKTLLDNKRICVAQAEFSL